MSVTSATTSPPSTIAAPASAIGADFNMFLRLLTTQMQNQDPLDPMDTSQYTQQLAQYSQVEQSIQQTGALKDILARLSAADLSQASGLIGRSVEFAGNETGLGAAGADWHWSLPKAPASLSATILDASGQVVATPSAVLATDGALHWDGLRADGSRAPEGAYKLVIVAKDAAGTAVVPTINGVGRVEQVLTSATGIRLGIGGIAIPASALISVRS